ncbi:ABC transporter substrate-binding protein [Aureimonas fodinaquatilis]|uniref:ABC transporter substrate-binding protein n=1 Tax=Aureimonas fodinaquatilis TaxID=2565783 RepID=A0A5B0DT40_9HYPH|nr:ABC transporter substrate-binding protein [Aureimonas fodinaquatilis]KAA0969573.1 ABC transporter substrate-binding protein [Aureimonas fodinaquatilis]
MKTLVKYLLAATIALPAGTAVAQDVTTLNILMPLPRSSNFYPLLVGEALGYFEEEGVAVNLLPSSTTIPYVAFIQNGQADLAMLDAPQTFQAAAAGVDMKVLYEGMQRAPEGIAVAGDSPYQNVAELKGTTVGLVSDRDRVTLGISLDAVGLTLDDVTTVVVGEGGPTLANAIQNQTVSAIAGAVPDWLAVQAHGLAIRLITPEEVEDTPANSFVGATARLEELQKPLEGFFRAWSKGMYAAEVDPDFVAAVSKAAVPEEWENEKFGREFLDASIPMNVSVTELSGDLQPEVWKKVQPPMVKQGAIDAEIDPATFLDDRFIASANDWDHAEVEAEIKAWRDANM